MRCQEGKRGTRKQHEWPSLSKEKLNNNKMNLPELFHEMQDFWINESIFHLYKIKEIKTLR